MQKRALFRCGICLLLAGSCVGGYSRDNVSEAQLRRRALSNLKKTLEGSSIASMDIFYMPLRIRTNMRVTPERLESAIKRPIRGKVLNNMRAKLIGILKEAQFGMSDLADFDVRFGFVLYDGNGHRIGSLYVNGNEPRAFANGVPGNLSQPAFRDLFETSVATREEVLKRYKHNVLGKRELDALRKRQNE